MRDVLAVGGGRDGGGRDGGGGAGRRLQAQPHAAMLYTRDETFKSNCDTSKLHAMHFPTSWNFCGDS